MADLLPRSVSNIAWLAGLLEGEGCFFMRGSRPTPIIQLVMTDVDIVIRAARILGANKVIRAKILTKGGKSVYRVNVFGRNAISWCMTLYTLMGDRRQEKIRECLLKWKEAKQATFVRQGRALSTGACVWVNPKFVNKAA